MSQGQGPQSDDGQQRARRYVGKLIEKFEIQVRANALAALSPREQFVLSRHEQSPPAPVQTASPPPVPVSAPAPTKDMSTDTKAAYRELVKPFVQRFTAAAKVDPQPFDETRQAEIQEKKVALTQHLKQAESLAQDPVNMEAAKAEVEKANFVATELFSRRYQLDADGKPQESKPLTPQRDAGERRDFAGREMLGRYQGEDRSQYDSRAQQQKSADYVDAEGHLVDRDGGRFDTDIKQKPLYTSRLDTGSSHSFSEADGHHSYAAGGGAVIGAGSRVVKRGIVRQITGDSGHYAPTALNIHEYVGGLAEQGVKLIDDEFLFMPDPQAPDRHIPAPDEIKSA